MPDALVTRVSGAREAFAGKKNALAVDSPDLTAELKNAFRDAYTAGTDALGAARGAEAAVGDAAAAAAAYADDRAGDLITDIDDSTLSRVEGIIASGVQAGLSDEEISAQLAPLFGDDRADLIARTEMSSAWNMGVITALKDAGEEYVAVSDGDGCEACEEADGEYWDIDEAEANPLEHPNCVRDFRPLTEDELADVQSEEAASALGGEKFYTPDQARDEHGRWSDEPGGGDLVAVLKNPDWTKGDTYPHARVTREPQHRPGHTKYLTKEGREVTLLLPGGAYRGPNDPGHPERGNPAYRDLPKTTVHLPGEKFYSEDQERDEKGRWSDGGSSSASSAEPSHEWTSLPGEPGYYYHATSDTNLHDIRDSGHLQTYGPSHGTDQNVWPDGGGERRSYFAESPKIASSFTPENGKPVILRVPREAANFRRESGTHDIYSRGTIGAGKLEFYGKDGSWHPVVESKQRTLFYSEDQLRDDRGRWTGGGDSGERAWNGKPVELKTHLTKAETGRICEAVILQHTRELGLANPQHLNVGDTAAAHGEGNFPVDLRAGDNVIEVKGGLVSNGTSAQQWRVTLGQPGPEERAMMDKMKPEALARYNAAKMEAAVARKEEVRQEISKSTGREQKAWTYGVILNPDKGLADIYRFPGWHARIGWKSSQAAAGFVTTVKWKPKP